MGHAHGFDWHEPRGDARKRTSINAIEGFQALQGPGYADIYHWIGEKHPIRHLRESAGWQLPHTPFAETGKTRQATISLQPSEVKHSGFPRIMSCSSIFRPSS